ncbi:MAG: hypothetical protein IJE65_00110 [Clostridia bacterium]|nr:hypothetical protein [Clostridia bacterium]
MKLPKVLVIGINSWRDNTGINTLINFFKDWDKENLAHLYTKSNLPKTEICDTFFRISENSVIKSVLKRSIKTGMIVENETVISDEDKKAAEEEKKRYASKGKSSLILSICRELVWKFGKWKTKELDEFIENYDADILFLPIYPTIYMCRIQKYIIKKTGKPAVTYLADDNYTYKSVSKNPLSLLHRFFLRRYVKYIVQESKQLMVIAPKQKEEYDKAFDKDSVVLTKGIDFSDLKFEPKQVSNPIKMVYTGKLIIGRDRSLSLIADALGEINKNGTRLELDIYTTETLSKKQQSALNRNGCSVKGALSLDEVQAVQKAADILVFVEGLENRYKNIARLSFSTKITDYLKSGKCIFAIGDKEIAPIDYFNRYDSAITASSCDEVYKKLVEIIDNPEIINLYGEKAFNCGKENHDILETDKLLKSTIAEIFKEDK